MIKTEMIGHETQNKTIRADFQENRVLTLRAKEIAESTKPFMARGYKLKRCARCLLAEQFCVCETANTVHSKHRIVLIMYRGEAIKPSNTGRLIAEILPNTLAFQWSRVNVNPELIQAIQDEHYDTYLVFPAMYANNTLIKIHQQREFSARGIDVILEKSKINTIPRHAVTAFSNDNNQPKQFILLDGTWSEAKKMFRKSPYLDHLPLLSFDEVNLTNNVLTDFVLTDYILREASREEQYGTASAAIAALQVAGDIVASETLRLFTLKFMQNYVAIKAR